MIDREHVFGLRNEAGRVAGILGRCGGGFQRLHGRAGCAREVRGMTLGGGTSTGGWLARFSRRHSLSASCNAEHVAVRRAYVRHDYAFTPLPLPLYLVPDCSLLLSLSLSLLPSFAISVSAALLIPGYTSFARFHFVPPPPTADYSGELSARASDFSVLLALSETFPITRSFSLRFDSQTTCRNSSEAAHIKKNVRNSIRALPLPPSLSLSLSSFL